MRHLIPILLLVMSFFSCENEINELQQILSEAPDAGPAYFDNAERYSLALGSYKDSAEIKFFISEAAPLMTMDETRGLIQDAVIMWGTAIDKPFREVGKLEEANIYFSFEFLDGKGGSFGFAEPPPYFQVKNWNRKITLDKYDINPESEFDAVTIIGHEVGHGIGMRHSHDKTALMNDAYVGKKGMSLDDHFGARILYDQKKKFSYRGTTYIPIENLQDSIHPNFLMSEFFSHCTDFSDDFHFLDERIPNAIQIIRDFYNQPIKDLSSYRDYDCNLAAGGAVYSQHKQSQAYDWYFVGKGARSKYHQFVNDVKNKGEIFDKLLAAGVGGFGAYNNAFHIDTRQSGAHSYNGHRYAIWGKFTDNNYTLDVEHPFGIN